MLFNSIEYLLFFPIVVMLYFSIPDRWKWIVLLVASYFFYACWKLEYVVLIMFTTLADYIIGLRIDASNKKHHKKVWLVLSVILNLGMLAGFKYLNFFTYSMNDLLGLFHSGYSFTVWNVLLPVGISFYIFQSLSYTIDVYRGTAPAERHLGKFALYVSFFPQLVAGPIERSTNLIPQFYNPAAFSHQKLVSGLKLMLWGFFKKLVIADRLGMFVNYVYDNPTQNNGITIILATALFAFQLYCDFSGYTDIARGSARVMGYDLMVNFNRPMIAQSLRDFWNRWHISLTTWFRDYLLYALPYVKNNRIIFGLFYRNLIITYLLMGLWHGASWNFVLFGAFHGVLIVLETLTDSWRARFFLLSGLEKVPKLKTLISQIATFTLVLVSLFFFRANTLSDSLLLFNNVFDFSTTSDILRYMRRDNELIFGILMVIALLIAERLHAKYNLVLRLANKPLVLRWSAYAGFLFFVVLFGVLHEEKFIYFQF